MNSKTCKALRQYHNIRNNDVSYDEIQHSPRLKPIGGFNPDGTVKMAMVKPVQRVIQAGNARQGYQQHKKVLSKLL